MKQDPSSAQCGKGSISSGSYKIIKSSNQKLPSYFKVISLIGVRNFLTLFFLRSKALKLFLTNFLLTYNLRAGVFLLLRLFNVLVTKPKAIFSLKILLDEAHFVVREEAVRTGLLVGGFTGIYRAVTSTLAKLHFMRTRLPSNLALPSTLCEREKREEDLKFVSKFVFSNRGFRAKKWHSALGGFLAGTSLVIMDQSWHRTLALYMAPRLVQCIYNYNRERGYFHFWSSRWNHGDALLFAITSAQIMYSYAMRPEVLPPSYYKFIRNQGPMDEEILNAARATVRGVPLDVKAYLNYIISASKGNVTVLKDILPYIFKVDGKYAADFVKKVKSSTEGTFNANDLVDNLELREKIGLIPLQGLHPYTTSSMYHTFLAFYGVARQIFPVYLALSLVPAVVLRYGKFFKAPGSILIKCLFNSTKSTLFLSLFCGVYQFVVNVHRWIVQPKNVGKLTVLPQDNKYIYWLAGFISSGTIFLEQKNRRSELALYALPRAADSVYLILNSRNLVKGIPHGVELLFCVSMSGIMYFYEHHNNNLTPLVSKLLNRFLRHDLVIQPLDGDSDTVRFNVDTSNSESGDTITSYAIESKGQEITHSSSAGSLTNNIIPP